MPSRCAMPRLNVLTGSTARASSPTSSSRSSMREPGVRDAVEVREQLEVLQRRQVEIDEGVVSEVPEEGAGAGGLVRQRESEHAEGARVGAMERREHP